MEIGPLVLEPRLDAKPWGGRRLARFGFALPPGETIGEALVTAAEATVVAGAADNRTLGEIVRDDPSGTIGVRGLKATGGRPIFPLLVKLIDASENLSIQVHPDDAAAAVHDSLGKTEAWYVLDAEPGSALYIGLAPGATAADLAAASRAGTGAAHLMRRLPARPNTLVFLPAGTVHALGAGVVIYEIQQPSAITYRLDDWGRVDAAGRPRELHIEAGLAVTDETSRPELTEPRAVTSVHGRRHLLVACPYFATERIALTAGEEIALPIDESPTCLTMLAGGATVRADGTAATVISGQTAVLLASARDASISPVAPSVLLRAWVP